MLAFTDMNLFEWQGEKKWQKYLILYFYFVQI